MTISFIVRIVSAAFLCVVVGWVLYFSYRFLKGGG